VITSGNKGSYLCGWPDSNLLSAIMKDQMTAAGLKSISLPEYLRVRQRGDLLFFTNYGEQKAIIPDFYKGEIILGSREMEQAEVTILSSKG